MDAAKEDYKIRILYKSDYYFTFFPKGSAL